MSVEVSSRVSRGTADRKQTVRGQETGSEALSPWGWDRKRWRGGRWPGRAATRTAWCSETPCHGEGPGRPVR